MKKKKTSLGTTRMQVESMILFIVNIYEIKFREVPCIRNADPSVIKVQKKKKRNGSIKIKEVFKKSL